jgi:ATP-binding cassette subfamily B protein
MINIFRRLTAKEWGMIALSTVFICLDGFKDP